MAMRVGMLKDRFGGLRRRSCSGGVNRDDFRRPVWLQDSEAAKSSAGSCGGWGLLQQAGRRRGCQGVRRDQREGFQGLDAGCGGCLGIT